MPTTRPSIDRLVGALTDNLVVLRGHLSSPPRPRSLRSGSSLLHLEVTTPGTEMSPASSVPVIWFDPPPRCGIDVSTPVATEVVVVGSVRRRFFRQGGVTASRTEVVAAVVTPTRRQVAVSRLICAVQALLDPAEGPSAATDDAGSSGAAVPGSSTIGS